MAQAGTAHGSANGSRLVQPGWAAGRPVVAARPYSIRLDGAVGLIGRRCIGTCDFPSRHNCSAAHSRRFSPVSRIHPTPPSPHPPIALRQQLLLLTGALCRPLLCTCDYRSLLTCAFLPLAAGLALWPLLRSIRGMKALTWALCSGAQSTCETSTCERCDLLRAAFVCLVFVSPPAARTYDLT